MLISFSRFSLAVLATTAAFTAPAHADFIGVSRCAMGDGTNAPALHIIDGGTRYLIEVGQGGLTRNIIFNERRALAWVAESGLFPPGSVFGNYDSYICGLLNEDAEEAPEIAPPPPPPQQPPPPPPPPPVDCEGFQCDGVE